MKNVIFNERRDIENIINSGEVTQDTVNKVISSMAKYNLYIKNLSDDEKKNIGDILKLLLKSFIKNVRE